MKLTRRWFLGGSAATAAAGPSILQDFASSLSSGVSSGLPVPPAAGPLGGKLRWLTNRKKSAKAYRYWMKLIESGATPDYLKSCWMEEARDRVRVRKAISANPAPRGAPEWLKIKMHVEAEYKVVQRDWLAKVKRQRSQALWEIFNKRGAYDEYGWVADPEDCDE